MEDNRNRNLMIAVAVVVILCCCCAVLAAGWQFGDVFLDALNF
jgi:hypothetical protein